MDTPPIDIPVKAFSSSIRRHQLEFLQRWDKTMPPRYVQIWHRRARKTTTLLNLAIREAVSHPNQTFAYVLDSRVHAKSMVVLDPAMLNRHLPREILARPFNESDLFAEFKNGSVLHIGGAEQIDRWKGLGCNGWILDEFSLMRNGRQLFEEIILPIVIANKGWVVFAFTPKGRNYAYEVWKKVINGESGWTGELRNVLQTDILTPEQVEQARQSMPERLFNQEMMVEFLQDGGGVIRRVEEAIAGELAGPQAGARYAIGVDLGKKQDWTVLTAMNCETRHVDGWERFNAIDWTLQKQRILQFYKKFNNGLVIIDSTGIGDPITDDLRRMGVSLREFIFTSKSKKQLVEKLMLAVEDRRITYPSLPDLVNELKDFDIDEQGRYGAPSGMHDDCVMSLALAVDGLGAEMFTCVDAEADDNTYISAGERWRVER